MQNLTYEKRASFYGVPVLVSIDTASVQRRIQLAVPAGRSPQLVIGCPVLLAMEGQIRYSC